MAFDGFITKTVCEELKTCLLDGKINKVFEPTKNEIVLSIYSHGSQYALLINIDSNQYRMHLTTHSKPNPLSAPNFCMLLRKYLIGCKIKEIVSFNLERLIEIKLEGYNELNDIVYRSLIIELMGKHSNIILLNENRKIIDSLRHLDSSSGSYRDILPAREYSFPRENKVSFLEFSPSEFENLILTDDLSLDTIVSNHFIGISKLSIQQILEKLSILPNSREKQDILKLYQYLHELISKLATQEVSCISYQNDYCIDLKDTKELLQVNFFLDDYYSKKEQNDNLVSYRNTMLKLILTQLKKIHKKLANINQKLEDCKNMDTYRLYGELITSNLYHIPKENLESVELENYYEENKKIVIPLDHTISPSSNAKKYFKKYNKLKNTLEIVSIQKKETQQEIEYLESIVYELESATTITDIDEIYNEISENVLFKDTFKKEKANIKKNKINKRKVHDTYEPLIYTVDGFTVYVGKNNKQNDYITTKLGKSEDYWFHTQDIRGSHVLLKTDGKEVKQTTLEAVASLAAYYSKGRLSSNVPVDYCFIKDVKKPSGSKPGMVIFKNYKTLYVNPKLQFEK